MRKLVILFVALLTFGVATAATMAQQPSASQQKEAEKAFDKANSLYEKGKPAEALTHYQKALAILPKEPAILFNAGVAAAATKDHALALDLFKQLKAADPSDWHGRSKLIQAYQALNKLPERDAERAELFEMWKKGDPPELKKEFEYCREQFEVAGQKVMAFEHFELTGERALRYVFSILNKAGDGEEYRISLGSYNLTNSIWRETTKPTPKEGERLWHLDGYFKNGHATYTMVTPEPSYDQVRAMVVKILEGKAKPASSSIRSTKP